MQLLKILTVYSLVDASKSFGKTTNQFTANNNPLIDPGNDQNIIVSKQQLSGRSANIINWLNGIIEILNKNQSNLGIINQYTQRQLPAKINWNWQRYIRSIIGTNEFKPLIHFDTGGGNFDRFIVSERRNDNPMLGWIISKFNRRGLDWSSGNLRLVNVQGNSLLGSDLIVHDRSIEIPLKRWLYILKSILKSNSNHSYY